MVSVLLVVYQSWELSSCHRRSLTIAIATITIIVVITITVAIIITDITIIIVIIIIMKTITSLSQLDVEAASKASEWEADKWESVSLASLQFGILAYRLMMIIPMA